MVLIVGIYLILSNIPIASCIVISFLPFVRSEGLIFLGVFGIYLSLKGKWRLIPLLIFGHVAYSIAGFYVYDDLLWVFNKIPYASLSSTYGSGQLFHFFEKMIFVVGVPIYILFWIGVIAIIKETIYKKSNTEFVVLIFIGFFSFFIAHTLFWYLGIFNSMGLKRVLVGVAPLSSIISLVGFNFLTELLQKKKILQIITQGLVIVSIVVFPFTANHAAIHWKSDLSLSKYQELANQTAALVSKHKTENTCFFYANLYLSESLNIDHFDSKKRIDLTKDFMNQIKLGDLVIWENISAPNDFEVTKEFLDSKKELTNIYNLKTTDEGREIMYSVYECK